MFGLPCLSILMVSNLHFYSPMWKDLSFEVLGGCPFNGRPLSVMQYPTRESSPSDSVVVDSVPVNGDVTACKQSGTTGTITVSPSSDHLAIN